MVKAQLNLCLIKHHTIKTYGRMKVNLHTLTVLDEHEWSASCSSCFSLGESSPTIYWIGSWIACKEKNLSLSEIKPQFLDTPTHSLVTIYYF
jgi:hypothetical protein